MGFVRLLNGLVIGNDNKFRDKFQILNRKESSGRKGSANINRKNTVNRNKENSSNIAQNGIYNKK